MANYSNTSQLLFPDQGILTPKPSQLWDGLSQLWDGLVCAWVPALGSTGGRLLDRSGRGNHGTLTNMTPATAWKTSDRGPALDFTGGDTDHVLVTDRDALDISQQITVACWVNVTSYNYVSTRSFPHIVSKWDSYVLRAFDSPPGPLHGWGFTIFDGSTEYTANGTDAGDTPNTGQWYHVAGTYDGNNVKTYVDGLLKYTTAHTGDIDVGANDLLLGNYESLSDARTDFDGLLESVLLYSRALTHSEIQHLYLDPYALFRRHTAPIPYPAAVTPTRRSRVFVPSSVLSSKPSVGTGYARSRSESSSPGLWDGLVGAWAPGVTGPTGSSLKDLSGNGNHGALLSSATWVASDRGPVVDTDGTNVRHVSIPDSSLFSPGNYSGFSVSVWAKANTQAGGVQWIVSKGNVGNYEWGMGIDSAQAMAQTWQGSASNSFGPINGGTVSTGEWHHYSFVYNGSALYLYFDGQVVASDTSITGSMAPDGTTDVVLGAIGDLSFSEWDGLIGTVAIHSRALALSEIQTLYRDHNAPFRPKPFDLPYPVTTPSLAPKRKADNSITPRQSARHPIRLSDGSVIERQPVYHHVQTPDTILSPKPSYGTGYARNAQESAWPQLWDGLVGAWVPSLGNTGGRLLDRSGRGNHGTISSATWTMTPRGTMLDYDETNDYVTLPALAFTTALSVVALVYMDEESDSTAGIVTKYVGQDENERSWGLVAQTSGIPAVALSSDGTLQAANNTAATTDIRSGWHHLAFTYRAGDATTIYVDGEQEGTNGTTPASLHQSSKAVLLGLQHYDAGDSNYETALFNGRIGSVALYSRVLTPSEIQHLYRDPLAPFQRHNPQVNLQPQSGPETAYFDFLPWEQPTGSVIRREEVAV